jgi:hypothetical protein
MQDRVHPGSGVHWLMAEAVLKAWNAPAVVTAVSLDASKASVTNSTNTSVTDIRKSKGAVSWTQLDRALPLPLPPAQADPFIAEVEKVSDLDAALNRQMLQIAGLSAGNYLLMIDESKIGEFPAEQLAAGIDLARMETPMLKQALLVAFDTERKDSIEDMHFHFAYDARTSADRDTASALAATLVSAVQQQRRDAQPVAHHYSVTPIAGR